MMSVLSAIGWLLSGVLLVNVLPHLIRGVSGDKFPSPFSKPHGKKLSSPTLNVIWAFVNLSLLLTIFHFNRSSFTSIYGVIMLVGAFAMSIFLSKYFNDKDKE